MKCNISHTPSTDLSDIHFLILNVLESLIAKEQKKYNNTEMKSGRHFTAATPAVANIKVNLSRVTKPK